MRSSSSFSARSLSLSLSLVLAGALLLLGACLGDEETPILEEDTAALTYVGGSLYDNGTQCTVGNRTMHCCPEGMVMIGADVQNNRFKCQRIGVYLGARYLDVYTQRNGMHACPQGSVMSGFHGSQNLLVCQPAAVAFEYVDGNPPTHDGNMHICPPPYALSGIHAGANKFTCGR